jgi:hypothetical protein
VGDGWFNKICGGVWYDGGGDLNAGVVSGGDCCAGGEGFGCWRYLKNIMEDRWR